MKLMIRSAILFLCLLSLATVTLSSPGKEQDNESKARLLWEQAIAAKGGREKLYGVRSLVVSYTETVRNFLGIVVHRGDVEQLYVFPDKSWAWDDGLPPPFHRTIRSLDIEHDRRCVLYHNATEPKCDHARTTTKSDPDEGLVQVQYLYLMETKWVQPVPFDVSTDWIGLKKVDVVHTRFRNKRIDYWLDRKTHLPLRVSRFHGSNEKPTYTIDISNYANVEGIQMPQKQKRGKISFQLNPEYDDTIFTRLSFAAGPKAWRKSEQLQK